MMVSGGSIVDFHNHVIPGVDDGASDELEAAAALRAFADQGIHDIIATPHVDGSLAARPADLARRLGDIDAGYAKLQVIAQEQFPDVRVYRGAEVALDTPDPDLSDERLRLNGSTFALVEYPFMRIPPNSSAAIRALVRAGVVPVIGHPERYAGMAPSSALPETWREHGALLQVNAGSITGRYGPAVRENALALLERGLAHYVCSDFHCRGRPSTAGARRLLAELGAAEQADLLIAVNPRRLLEGTGPLSVPPLLLKKGLMTKVKRWFR